MARLLACGADLHAQTHAGESAQHALQPSPTSTPPLHALTLQSHGSSVYYYIPPPPSHAPSRYPRRDAPSLMCGRRVAACDAPARRTRQ